LSTKNSLHSRGRHAAQPLDARLRARRLIAIRREPGEQAAGAAPQRRRVALDQQQALLVGALNRAGGGPVSYGELRDAGIEYPASVMSELELAGLPLERCYEGPLSARRLLGVRLDPRHISPDGGGGEEPEPTRGPVLDGVKEALAGVDVSAASAALAERARRPLAWLFEQARIASRAAGGAVRAISPTRAALLERARQARGPANPRRRRWSPSIPRVRARRAPAAPGTTTASRWLAPAALIAAAAVLAALAVGGLAGAGHGRGASAGRAPRATSSAARRAPAPSPKPPSPARQPSPPVPATPVSPALAAQLEAGGHELLEAGEVQRAVPLLERALIATGESLNGCLEPVSETCLSYAYALYDLGRALRLDRQPAAAVLILERRLQIANQRPTVQSELALARHEAGRQAPIASATG
jgi:hypothetical protein